MILLSAALAVVLVISQFSTTIASEAGSEIQRSLIKLARGLDRGSSLGASDVEYVRNVVRVLKVLDNDQLEFETLNSFTNIILGLGSEEDLQEEILEGLQNRVGIDVDAGGYALIRDLVEISHGRKQQFGSILMLQNGRATLGTNYLKFNPLRENIGLSTIGQYINEVNNRIAAGETVEDIQRLPIALITPHYPQKPGLRRQLLDLMRLDQGARPLVQSESYNDGLRRLEIDRQNLSAIKLIIDRHGFPTVADVGRSGVQAVFLLVQHAAGDVPFMERALGLAMPLMKSGDLSRVYYALLVDRVRILKNQKQLYGTQSGIDIKGKFFYPVEDPEHMNIRRIKMRMAPLQDNVLDDMRMPVIKAVVN